jgi:outer membrane protein assembly factor BamB
MRIIHPSAARSRPRLDAFARIIPILLAIVLAACGGGDGSGTGPVEERVASVTLAGAPAGPVLAGSTVQLTATPVNAGGTALQRTVTWTSGDTTIAKVSPAGAVSVVGAGIVTVTARADGKEAAATLDARAGGEVGPAGGTLSLLGGRITLAVPAGSLSAPMTVLFRPAIAPLGSPRLAPGTAFEMTGPPQLVFQPDAQLTLAYDPARLPAGVSAGSLQLYQFATTPGVGPHWLLVRGSRADPVAHTVTGSIPFGGTYALVATAAAAVSLDDDLAGAALYVGQTRQLTAAAVDVNGDTLPGGAAWTTSDPSRATVDALGRVTGQAAGTVTITATQDGKSASVTLPILPRPAAAWNQAAEWSGAGGNARHDGYVAATLDPSVFARRWDKQFAAGLQLQPVATGSGQVFVLAGAFNASTLRLSALAAADGAERWGRTYTVSSISPPAFGNGRVYMAYGVHNEGARLTALDPADGAVRFSSSYFQPFSTSAPVVDGGGVYVGGWGGAVHRADALTGAWSWHTSLGGDDALIPAVNGGRVVVFRGSTHNVPSGVVSLDAATGAQAGVVVSSVAVPRQTPVLGGAGNVIGGTASALMSAPLQAGAPAWTQGGFFPRMPVVGQGVVFAVRGREVAAYRESSGSLLWTWGSPSGEPWVSMIATNNLLFVSVEDFNGMKATYAVDIASGRHVWSYPARGFLALSADGTLYIAAPEGRITAIAVR